MAESVVQLRCGIKVRIVGADLSNAPASDVSDLHASTMRGARRAKSHSLRGSGRKRRAMAL